MSKYDNLPIPAPDIDNRKRYSERIRTLDVGCNHWIDNKSEYNAYRCHADRHEWAITAKGETNDGVNGWRVWRVG